MNTKVLLTAGALILAGVANAQVSFTGSNYTQDFDTLASSGTTNTWTDNTTLAGWYSTRVVLFADDGASNAGRLGSAGTTASTERALASLCSGSTGPISFGAQLVNNTANTITGFTLSYRGEQWRSSTTQQNNLTFDWRLGGTTITGTDFTAASALDFLGQVPVTTNGALDGNANFTNISGSVSSIAWAPGQSLWLRWNDIDNTGSDALLGVDDLTFSAQAVPEPASFAILGVGALALLRRRRSA